MSIASQRGLRIEIPEDGALVSGLYFEGCRWDYEAMCIAEQRRKELFSKVPIIWLQPKVTKASGPASLQADKVTVLDNTSNITDKHSVHNKRNLHAKNDHGKAGGPKMKRYMTSETTSKIQ